MDLQDGLDIISDEDWIQDIQVLMQLAEDKHISANDAQVLGRMLGTEFSGDFSTELINKLTKTIQDLKQKCQSHQVNLREMAMRSS
jgi:hypothetical protein